MPKWVHKTATSILCVCLADSLYLQPLVNLEDSDHGCICSLRDRYGISNVIGMPVCQQNKVSRQVVGAHRSQRIACQERINQDNSTINIELECRVAEPGNFY